MSEKIIINPITRISGFLQIEVTIEKNIVTGARNNGFLFRGFEEMLKGRSPFDAIYFTERICGICSTAHGFVSAISLENALNIVPDENGAILREIMHACEFLQNHIRHFYQFTMHNLHCTIIFLSVKSECIKYLSDSSSVFIQISINLL